MRHEAILNLYPNVVIVDDTAGAFDAEGNEVALDQSAVDTEVARLQAEYDSKAYARARAEAYLPIAEQLDLQYWDSVNGTTNWADHIAAVKAMYPAE